MKFENILTELEEQLREARAKFPSWSLDPVHGAAIMAEEAGEALQAALDFYYGRAGSHHIKRELLHTATMAIRFLMNFEASERWMNNYNKGKEEITEALRKLKEEAKK